MTLGSGPSRLSLSRRKRRERKEQLESKSEKKLKNIGPPFGSFIPQNICIGVGEKKSVIEILSSDDEAQADLRICEDSDKDRSSAGTPIMAFKEIQSSTSLSNSRGDTTSGTCEEESNNNNIPSSCIKDSPRTPQRPLHITYKSSAYTQNLAEISYDIMNDARWRCSNERLFRWETGDDLSVLLSFSRLFIKPSSKTGGQGEKASEDEGSGLDLDKEELHARCMHLYARLFHRKGPWFQITDIFTRYYHRDYIRRRRYKMNENDESDIKNPDEVDDVSWDNLEGALSDCILDLCRLVQMGAIRSFESESECGEIVGRSDSKLLTEKDKLQVLHKLGGGAPKNNGNKIDMAENIILQQMKSQRTMVFRKKGGLLPVRNHVKDTILNTFATKLISLMPSTKKNKNASLKSTQHIKDQLKRIWKSVSSKVGVHISLLATFRLREQPLLALRRACRLYLLAGDGPGSMKWSGSNAWISVIEADENFHSRKNQERTLLKGICAMPYPPTSSELWHQVDFHGLNHRMGLKFFPFADKYVRIPVETDSQRKCFEIFHACSIFKVWEVAAELRCMIDYLLEWNRLVLYADRKLQRSTKKPNALETKEIKDCLEPCIPEAMNTLSTHGRSRLCHQFATFCKGKQLDKLESAHILQGRVETIINSLHSSIPGNIGFDAFVTDAERLICSIGVISSQVLLMFFQNLPEETISKPLKRPWLRHLQPESVLAYIVWSTIDTMEKRGYYEIACQMLETIIFGFVIDGPEWNFDSYLKQIQENVAISHVSQVLLSRRVRGKAIERLIIDRKHLARKVRKSTKNRSVICPVDKFTAKFIPIIASTASVPISFLRKFARRIKQPLVKLLDNEWSAEIFELDIRLVQDACIPSASGMKSARREQQWSPTIDTAVANAIRHEIDSGASTRCSYIGDEDGFEHTRSLNVEELAIELYAAGKLPLEETDDIHKFLKGGWRGWHCEGLHVRVLFRIMCGHLLLESESCIDDEHYSIFLQPYQVAPLDLHVAYSIFRDSRDSKTSVKANLSFYTRRRKRIEEYFKRLEGMSAQELCDLIFELVTGKVAELKRLQKKFTNEQSLFRDIQQVRTLSMLAAGFGGRQLTAMFRLLCFDYRHYGAGLPDLLLVRAFTRESKPSGILCKPLDLNQWIGEVFQHSPNCTSSILEDRDEEFLGGSLNDRQGLSTYQKRGNNSEGFTFEGFDPERLVLSQNGSPVTIECMFVEVKSHNDRLDDRQEDWLNVLDRFGNARLCKFKSSESR